ncbi:MSMEG_0569 family flavin-dependent oxidoreductase [Nakamurella sp. YIM 132087]|uniref:MSMEG_0569 family flavin-dependent oxidoreductase n=1 Tax=Nakamurella alba TaxID=2665158 RepID=A0A7K1FNK1_9ACTN|nr:MSMEG_0569 family flavin-dependent oxidoreductase [Nakamurella alba]MTD14364.1 MSMEG_0569 family flavin-dependent oxidoreductase [Nakamurella alba]
MNGPGTEYQDVVVIGGGQAGLSISALLLADGIDHVVLEQETVAHEWRDGRWDNFTLVTPNFQCRLPGCVYDGPDPDGFMRRDEVYEWVRSYAGRTGAPVREHTAVRRLEQVPGGGFRVATDAGVLHAGQVVIATGGYHHPVVPGFADRLPIGVRQLHSSEYRSAAALPDGDVLVVGTGQSGAQIAEDLLLDGRRVHLAVGGAPRVARFYRGRDCVAWLEDMGVYDRGITPDAAGRAQRDKTNHYVTGRDGGRDIDLRDFALRGMQLYGRMIDIVDGQACFAPTLTRSLDAADAVMESIKNDIDGWIATQGIDAPVEQRYRPVWVPPTEPTALELAGVGAVVWAIGYRGDYSWLDLPVFDAAGRPEHDRGVTPVPGCYFLGLPWLHTWGSGRFAGIARDAGHLAGVIGARCRSTAGVLV